MNDVEKNIEANHGAWGGEWGDDGEQWSQEWGGSQFMFQEAIYPLIEPYLPIENLLEIAVGYGRVSAYLIDYCDHFYGCDLNQNCVDYTRNRLPQATIELTDGLSIPFGEQFNVIFSWDSLVHCHPDIVKSYINEARSSLVPGGAIVLHHSTWASSGAPGNPHWRNEQSDAADIKAFAEQLGFQEIEQRISNWGYEYPTDCITKAVWMGEVQVSSGTVQT